MPLSKESEPLVGKPKNAWFHFQRPPPTRSVDPPFLNLTEKVDTGAEFSRLAQI